MTTNETPGPSGTAPDQYLEDISADELSANTPADETNANRDARREHNRKGNERRRRLRESLPIRNLAEALDQVESRVHTTPEQCYALSIENAGGNNDTKCLYFPFCLDHAPLTWLESLEKYSIDKWDQLKEQFTSNFTGAMGRSGTRMDLAMVKQEQGETLRKSMSLTRRSLTSSKTISTTVAPSKTSIVAAQAPSPISRT
jgi:hypothetical protein